jgi:hypothetical protein
MLAEMRFEPEESQEGSGPAIDVVMCCQEAAVVGRRTEYTRIIFTTVGRFNNLIQSARRNRLL